MSIAENLAALRTRIAAAATAAARAPDSVALVAVSKTNPAEAVAEALAAGQVLFGENRVQEAAQKFPALREAHPELRLHLIGALQTNKARDAVRIADVIESLDRERLAHALAEAIAKEGRAPSLLIQVNTGEEPQKAGVPRAEAEALLRLAREELALPVHGLMCIPPAKDDPAPHFRWLASFAAEHRLAVLSMGMSADFEAAIAAGATHVRLGTAVFGGRGAPGEGSALSRPLPAGTWGSCTSHSEPFER
jgi:PLP dependent protein